MIRPLFAATKRKEKNISYLLQQNMTVWTWGGGTYGDKVVGETGIDVAGQGERGGGRGDGEGKRGREGIHTTIFVVFVCSLFPKAILFYFYFALMRTVSMKPRFRFFFKYRYAFFDSKDNLYKF